MFRIALTSPYDFSYPGGVNQHVRQLASHLRQRGHMVEIIAPCSQAKTQEEGLLKVRGGICSIPFSGSIARLALSTAVWHQVKQLLRARQYDLIHIHEPTTPLLSLAVLHHSRTINIGTFHQYRERHPIYELSGPFIRRFTKRLHGRIAVSEAAADFAQRYFPNPYRIIPNGIEVQQFDESTVKAWEEFRNDGKLNILFVGRLDKRKGFRYLLRAFRYVKQTIPEARLFVVGAYSRKDRITYVRYIRHFRIRDVKFIGFVSEADKARWYKTAHLFCAPSTGCESFGIVLTEAMSAGLPIIASDIPGYRDVIQDGVTGALVPPKDDMALATMITHLLHSTTYRAQLGKNAQQAVSRYDWPSVTQDVEAYYREILYQHSHHLARTPMQAS